MKDDLEHTGADRELVMYAGEEPIARITLQVSKTHDRVIARSLRGFADAIEEEAPEDAISPDDCTYTVDNDL